MLTVGVAPGSYTLTVPPNIKQLGDCVVDTNGPFGYGLYAHGWYDAPSAWYDAQFVAPATNMGSIVPGSISTAPPPGTTVNVPLDPYGTDSTLKGLAASMTFLGIRVDVLGIMAAAALGIGLVVHHFAKPKRRQA